MQIRINNERARIRERKVDIWQLRSSINGELLVVLLNLNDGKQLVLYHRDASYPPGYISTWWNVPPENWEPFEGTITLSNDD